MKEIKVQINYMLPAATIMVSPDVFSLLKDAASERAWGAELMRQIGIAQQRAATDTEGHRDDPSI